MWNSLPFCRCSKFYWFQYIHSAPCGKLLPILWNPFQNASSFGQPCSVPPRWNMSFSDLYTLLVRGLLYANLRQMYVYVIHKMVNYLRAGTISYSYLYLVYSMRINLALNKYFKNCNLEQTFYCNRNTFSLGRLYRMYSIFYRENLNVIIFKYHC